MLIQIVHYGNPDFYPPMINMAYVSHSNGYELSMLCTDYTSPYWVNNYVDYPPNTNLYRLHIDDRPSLRRYLSFISFVLHRYNENSKVIIGYDMYSVLPARLIAWRLQRPFIYHIHDYTLNNTESTWGQSIVKYIERLLAPTADLVIIPDTLRAEIVKRELKLRQPVVIVANAALRPPKEAGRLHTTLSQRGIQFSKIVFRQGKIGEGHAIETTIHSIPLWKQRDWGFVIMGIHEDTYRQHLELLARQLGVEKQFVVLPPVDYPSVGQFTVEADLGHGLYEPVNFNHTYATQASNKIMEYIAAGLPLILDNNSSNNDIITRYNNGVVANSQQPESIAQAVNSVLGNEKLAARMREGSKRAYIQEYNYEQQYLPVLNWLAIHTK